ncbi:MAG: hypothetical protein ACKV0T_18380 [Planctomycetales bacterium]
MSRRSNKSESAVSLFPFLAVLMCTMGALILLLIAMSNKIRQQAIERELAERQQVQPLPPEPPPTAVPQEPDLESAEEERAGALAAREARRAEREAEWERNLAATRRARDEAQQGTDQQQRQFARAQRKLKELQARRARAAEESDATQQARVAALAAEQNLKATEQQLVSQISATRRNLDLTERKQATAGNQFALIPYDGTSGTVRRPIYIECTDQGYRFLGEDVTLGPRELDGFFDSPGYNPLLSGTQALLRYWNVKHKALGNREPEPYVLLIVRPNGSVAYHLARALLAPVGAHFGYELVDDGVELAKPESDPEARATLQDAIDVTLAAREKLRATRIAGGRGRDARGGLGNYRNLFQEEQDRISRGKDESPGGAGLGGDRLAGKSKTGTAPAVALADRPPDGGDSVRGSNGAPGGGTLAAEGDRVKSAIPSQGGAATPGTPPTGATGRAAAGSPGGTAGGRGRARPATMSGAPGTEVDEGAPQESVAARRSGGGFESNSQGAGGNVEPPFSPLPDEVHAPHGHLPPAPAARDPNAPGRLRTIEPDPDGEAPFAPGGGEASGKHRDDLDRARPLRRDGSKPNGARQTQRPDDQGTPGTEGDSSPWFPTDEAVDREGSKSAGSGFPSLSSSGGGNGEPAPPGGKKRWGRSSARAGIGLERRMEIHVRGDLMMIGPNEVAIPLDASTKTEELTQRVMAGIEQTAQSWGAPPANFYWLPAVRFVIFPGGNGYYERLRAPLEKAGVATSVQYQSEETPRKKRGGRR